MFTVIKLFSLTLKNSLIYYFTNSLSVQAIECCEGKMMIRFKKFLIKTRPKNN